MSLNKTNGFIVLRAGSYSGTINIVYFTAYNLTTMTAISKAGWLGNSSDSDIQLYKKDNTSAIYVKNNTTSEVNFEIFIA